MKLRSLIIATALMLGFTTSANAFFIDLSGLIVDGAAPLTLNYGPNGDTGAVIDVSFDFIYEAGGDSGISWGSELGIELTHQDSGETAIIGTNGNACGGCDFDLMFPDDPGVFNGVGSLDFSLVLDGSGLWEISLTDSFDDAGFDGIFLGGGITITQQDVNPVPAPGVLLLIGIGIVGAAFARRRSV